MIYRKKNIEQSISQALLRFSEEQDLEFIQDERASSFSSSHYDFLYTDAFGKHRSIYIHSSISNTISWPLHTARKCSNDLKEQRINDIYLINSSGWFNITPVFELENSELSKVTSDKRMMEFNLKPEYKITSINARKNRKKVSVKDISNEIANLFFINDIKNTINPSRGEYHSGRHAWPEVIIMCLIALVKLLMQANNKNALAVISNVKFLQQWPSKKEFNSFVSNCKKLNTDCVEYIKICDILLEWYIKYLKEHSNKAALIFNQSQFHLSDFLIEISSGELSKKIQAVNSKEIAKAIVNYESNSQSLAIIKEECYRFLHPDTNPILDPYGEPTGVYNPALIKNLLISSDDAFDYIYYVKEYFQGFNGKIYADCNINTEIACSLLNYDINILREGYSSNDELPNISLAVHYWGRAIDRTDFFNLIHAYWTDKVEKKSNKIDNLLLKCPYSTLLPENLFVSERNYSTEMNKIIDGNKIEEVLQYKKYPLISVLMKQKLRSRKGFDLIFRDVINMEPLSNEDFKNKYRCQIENHEYIDEEAAVGFWPFYEDKHNEYKQEVDLKDNRLPILGLLPKRFQKIEGLEELDTIYFNEIFVEDEREYYSRVDYILFKDYFPTFTQLRNDKITQHLEDSKTGIKVFHLSSIYNISIERILSLKGIAKYSKGSLVSFNDFVKLHSELDMYEQDVAPGSRSKYLNLYKEGEYILKSKYSASDFILYQSDCPFFIKPNWIVIKIKPNALDQQPKDIVSFLNSPLCKEQLEVLSSPQSGRNSRISKNDIGLVLLQKRNRLSDIINESDTDLQVLRHNQQKEEEKRNEMLRKALETTNTLQESLTNEKDRLNDERVKEMLELTTLQESSIKERERLIRESSARLLEDKAKHESLINEKIRLLDERLREQEESIDKKIDEEVNKRIYEFLKGDFHTVKDEVRYKLRLFVKMLEDESGIELKNIQKQIEKKDYLISESNQLCDDFDDLVTFYKNLYNSEVSTINNLFKEIKTIIDSEKKSLKRDGISIMLEGDFFEEFEKQDEKKKKGKKKQLGNIRLNHSFVKTVISELIKNSRKYAWDKKYSKHKEITINLSKKLNLAIVDEDDMNIQLEYGEHGKDLLQIQYNDNGEGFTDDQLKQLFKSPGISFHEQTKESSSGYGLWKLGKTINKLDGEVSAKKVENGSCFEICLPFNIEL